MKKAILVLLQKDLRLRDNPALYYAIETKKPVIVVYVEEKKIGAAGKWRVYESLKLFSLRLEVQGIPLLYANESSENIINSIINYIESKILIDEIYSCGIDFNLPEAFRNKHKIFSSNLIFQEAAIKREFKIFSPFWKYLITKTNPLKPLGLPNFTFDNKALVKFSKFNIASSFNGSGWWDKLKPYWNVGEDSAQKAYQEFKAGNLKDYSLNRDFFSHNSTSKLSAHIRFGEISVRQIYYELFESYSKFLSELGWREFAYHTLKFHPDMQVKSLNPKYNNFYPKYDETYLKAWKEGKTGYPIVDAAMRELWQTGRMHNRLRMICASFLTKNLLIPWQIGAAWFFDCLVDGDAASNSLNWQWVAGVGLDSAPYFRVFNPMIQGKKYDSDGLYVKSKIKDLKNVEDKFIHCPFLAPASLFKFDYPKPIVDLKISRANAIKAYKDASS